MTKQSTDRDREEKNNSLLRLAFSIVMLLGGSLVVVVTAAHSGNVYTLVKSIGLAFIIAGVVSLFRELVIERWRTSPVDCLPDMIAQLQRTGMRMICFPRKGHWRYHTWFLVNDPQELFFAGRSVLHRIQEDFHIRRIVSVEDAFIRKMQEGSKIRVLFCDPTWSLIPAFAEEEAQPIKSLQSDLATSLGIVNRLWAKLRGQSIQGEIEIRLYQEHVQYAYHHTKNLQTGEVEMMVGFYFARKLGCKSPLFQVDDQGIQSEFEDHFANVFARASNLLEYPSFGHGKAWDQELLLKCQTHLVRELGEDLVERAMGTKSPHQTQPSR